MVTVYVCVVLRFLLGVVVPSLCQSTGLAVKYFPAFSFGFLAVQDEKSNLIFFFFEPMFRMKATFRLQRILYLSLSPTVGLNHTEGIYGLTLNCPAMSMNVITLYSVQPIVRLWIWTSKEQRFSNLRSIRTKKTFHRFIPACMVCLLSCFVLSVFFSPTISACSFIFVFTCLLFSLLLYSFTLHLGFRDTSFRNDVRTNVIRICLVRQSPNVV